MRCPDFANDKFLSQKEIDHGLHPSNYRPIGGPYCQYGAFRRYRAACIEHSYWMVAGHGNPEALLPVAMQIISRLWGDNKDVEGWLCIGESLWLEDGEACSNRVYGRQ